MKKILLLAIILSATQTAMADADYGKRFVARCPLADGSRLEVAAPQNIDSGFSSQPGGYDIKAPAAWTSHGSSRIVKDGWVHLVDMTDHLDNNFNTPECYYEEDVRYVLSKEILKKYSCVLTLSKVFVCDKIVD